MSTDTFSSSADSAIGPARQAYTVTPADATELPVVPKALWVGGGGTLVLRAIDSTADVVLHNVAAGQVVDVRALYVRATGTTATDIVAFA